MLTFSKLYRNKIGIYADISDICIRIPVLYIIKFLNSISRNLLRKYEFYKAKDLITHMILIYENFDLTSLLYVFFYY